MSKTPLEMRKRIALSLASESYDEIKALFEESRSFNSDELGIFHKRILAIYASDLDEKIDEVENTLLCHAAASGRLETLVFLLDNLANRNAANASGNTALSCAIILGNLQNGHFLLAAGSDPAICDYNGLNCQDYLAAIMESEQDDAKRADLYGLFCEISKRKKSDIDDLEIEEQIKLCLAKIILRGFYSESDIMLQKVINLAAIISRLVPDLEIVDAVKTKLVQVFNKISRNEDFLKEGKKFKIVKSSFENHSSYFVVEFDENNEPKFLHYVDGYCPLATKVDGQTHYCGAVRFALRAINSAELESELGKITKYDLLERDLVALVECDVSGKPQITESNILTTQQGRRNCSFKSLSLLCQTMLLLTGELREFQDVEPDVRKVFKYALIEYCARQVIEMSAEKNVGKIYHEEANIISDETTANARRKLLKSDESMAVELATKVDHLSSSLRLRDGEVRSLVSSVKKIEI